MAPETETKKPTLSFSRATKMLKCPRLYYLEEIRRVETFATGAMIQSSAWHEAVAKNFQQKIRSGVDLPVEQVVAIFMSRLDEKFKLENVRLKENENRPAIEAQGVAITEFFHATVALTISPIFVEKYFRVSLGTAFPYDITGIWDLVDIDHRVIDLKAYSKTPSQKDIDKNMQLTWYGLAYRILFHEAEGGLGICAVIKNKLLRCETFSTARTTEDCMWLLGLIERAADAIGKGCDFPNPGGWWCGPDMCAQWDLCHAVEFHGGKKT